MLQRGVNSDGSKWACPLENSKFRNSVFDINKTRFWVNNKYKE